MVAGTSKNPRREMKVRKNPFRIDFCPKTPVIICPEKAEASECLLLELYVEGCGVPLADVRSPTWARNLLDCAWDFRVLVEKLAF